MKSEGVKDTSYAEGGPVLGRERSFLKEGDPFVGRNLKSEKPPESPKQDYEGGKPKGADKCLPEVTPRT